MPFPGGFGSNRNKQAHAPNPKSEVMQQQVIPGRETLAKVRIMGMGVMNIAMNAGFGLCKPRNDDARGCQGRGVCHPG
jgi:hypothetical protein